MSTSLVSHPSFTKAQLSYSHVSKDFYNKHLDLAELKIRLPGITINLADYWSGFPIRYVCRSKDAKVTFFVMELELV